MVITPNSEVHLLNVPLENDYKNQIYFANVSAQTSYFTSKIVHSFNNLTYQRKENSIHVPKNIDELYNCNYVMYRNSNYSNKWFYAFITNMEYNRDGLTFIHIETDVYQTWLFDVTIKPSFVEREHVIDDIVGNHTFPEGLETGEHTCYEKIEDSKGQDLLIYMAYSDYSEDIQGDVKGKNFGGIYSGMAYDAYGLNTAGITSLNEQIAAYDKDSKADAINSIFMGPKWLSGIADADFTAGMLGPHTSPRVYNPPSITKPVDFNGYVPRNKKLLTFPYCYLGVSNNAGGNVIYHYEHFGTEKCDFEVSGVITPGCSIRMNPIWYKGSLVNNDEGINGGKYPICCWNSDTYTNWLTSNGVNIALQVASGVGQIVAGGGIALASGGLGLAVGGSGVVGGVSTIASTLAQVHQQSLVPDQARGNTNCGDVITGSKENCFMFYKMGITLEYLKRLDGFFDMFGYKVNTLKVPNVSARPHWNYVKTIDINIDGAIPNDDMQKLKDMYNRGVTLWKNGSNVGNYSLNNSLEG